MIKPANPLGRVVIVGAGMVGSSVAYALILKNIAKEILLLDISEELAKAQVLDLEDAAAFSDGVSVSFGDYSQIRDGDIVVITAGAAQKPGETRTDLLLKNEAICTKIFNDLNATNKQLFVLLVTNPVDVITYLAKKKLNQPSNRVFGSGTLLDTARLKDALAKEVGTTVSEIDAFTIGEHGDSSFPVLSAARISGKSLDEHSSERDTHSDVLGELVRQKAYKIIKGKSATYFGIGAAVSEICNAIIENRNSILCLSVEPEGQYGLSDICIGLPVSVGEHGYSFAKEIPLDANERNELHKSARVIKENISMLQNN